MKTSSSFSMARVMEVGIASIVVTLYATAVEAALITYEASGVVDVIYEFTGSPNDITVGDPFTVSFTLDDAVIDVDPDPTYGEFWNIVEITVSVGSASATPNTSFFDLEQYFDSGEAEWWFGGDEDGTVPRSPFDGGFFLTSLGVEPYPFAATGLDPNSVWTPLPGLSTGAAFKMSLLACASETGFCNASYGVEGAVTSFELIPEPSSAVLLQLGLLGFAAQCRSARRHPSARRR